VGRAGLQVVARGNEGCGGMAHVRMVHVHEWLCIIISGLCRGMKQVNLGGGRSWQTYEICDEEGPVQTSPDSTLPQLCQCLVKLLRPSPEGESEGGPMMGVSITD